MALFQPETLIYFCRTGIDDTNKPYFDDTEVGSNKIVTWMLEGSARVATAQNYSFQRTDGRLRIAVDSSDASYDTLVTCDTLCYINRNEENNTAMWVVCNITAVEWINPGNTYVYYKVDYYCTYANRIDWNNSVCYVEREHVKEDWVQNGGECPAFSNMGTPENFNYEPDTPVYYSMVNMLPKSADPKIVIYSPYGKGGEKPEFNKDFNWSNTYSGLTPVVLNVDEVADYLLKVAESEEADLDRVPLIQTLPNICNYGTPHHTSFTVPMPWMYETANISITNDEFTADYHKNVNSVKYRNAKCWSSQFCKMRLIGFNGDTIDYNPQWFGNGIKDTTMEIYSVRTDGGISIVCGLKPKNIEMSPKGMTDFMMQITEAPQSPWVGNMYAQWSTVNSPAMSGRMLSSWMRLISGLFGGAVSGGTGIATGDVAKGVQGMTAIGNSLANATSSFGNISTSFREAKTNGAAVGGSFAQNANTAAAQELFGVELVAYIVQPYIMNSVDDFFDMFGYQVNKVKVPERNTRKYWNFVKTHSAHLAGKELSFVARSEIERMLNNGVTFWNGTNVQPEGGSGVCMGDYSLENREQNRAVGG